MLETIILHYYFVKLKPIGIDQHFKIKSRLNVSTNLDRDKHKMLRMY